MTPYRKKLIEVALPLEAINIASAQEKEPFTRNHPRSLHIWWARRPLAACRAVLFASLVDDPSSHPDKFPTEKAQERERQRLFRIIEELVKWENVNNERVLLAARKEILKSTDNNPPPVLDPFCGGGSIPLEAQRLGLKAYASDLNPVAVLITKALIEIPPLFAGRPPVNPKAREKMASASAWQGAAGLAEDVRYYGQWMRDEAEKRIGHLYPKVKLPKEYGGGQANVIAWLWTRTVKCPNPACGALMPLVRSFALSAKEGKKVWVETVINKRQKTVKFEVKTGKGAPPDGTVNRRGARCIVCGEAVPLDHVRAEGKAGRMTAQLMAIVAEGERGRVYLPPSDEHSEAAAKVQPAWTPQGELQGKCRVSVPLYGMNDFSDLFTPRQNVALTTFSDLVGEAHELVKQDAITAGLAYDNTPLHASGKGATAYADSLAVYLSLALSRWTDLSNSLATWNTTNENVRALFARQAIPMTWDFVELSPFGDLAPIDSIITATANILRSVSADPGGNVSQLNATTATQTVKSPIVCTDPPYYDNIGYADLSDFFYVWLRPNLNRVYPALFSTLLTPKTQELVAAPHRFDGDRQKAQQFFERGLVNSFRRMRDCQHPDYPLTVFYAFKQAEAEQGEEKNQEAVLVASTGWETMLEGLLKSEFTITGTWPMRTERGARSVAMGTNALASSIVLVCRPRPEDAPLATRREFVAALRRELPEALKKLQQGNVVPVDFAQATIGPGMSVFSRYSKILEADGSPMRVRTALQLINQELEAYFAQQEGDLDPDTRFCVEWFGQYGMNEGGFGEADVLARAKNTSVQGLVEAGVLQAKAGKVRLLKRDEMDDDWDPLRHPRLTVWESMQYLIRALQKGGEPAAGQLAAKLGGDRSETARALAYRLYAICDRKGWAQEALAYNSLVASWGDVQAQAPSATDLTQQQLGGDLSPAKTDGKIKKSQGRRSR